jgi:hypothetical protein
MMKPSVIAIGMALYLQVLLILLAAGTSEVQAFSKLPPAMQHAGGGGGGGGGNDKPDGGPANSPTASPTDVPPDGPGDFPGVDQPCDANWNQTAVEYAQNLEKWGNPDCYYFTIQRSCFCSEDIRNPTEVKVENGEIVSPSNYEDLFLLPMEDLFAQVNNLCVKNCPEKGSAQCDVTYGEEGNLESAYIDRSEMVADEEIIYDITNYRTCSENNNVRRRIRALL